MCDKNRKKRQIEDFGGKDTGVGRLPLCLENSNFLIAQCSVGRHSSFMHFELQQLTFNQLSIRLL